MGWLPTLVGLELLKDNQLSLQVGCLHLHFLLCHHFTGTTPFFLGDARNGLWHYGEQIIVPDDEELQQRCIFLHHDGPTAGHPGRNNTLELIQRQFWWPSLRRDVNVYVAGCASCQQNKTQSQQRQVCYNLCLFLNTLGNRCQWI
jgi:hypothetical protein